MKRLIKLLTIILIVIIILLVGIQVALNYAMQPVVDKELVKLSKDMGLKIKVDDIALNLFMGTASVDGVNVSKKNGAQEPNSFTLERSVIDVAMLALPKGIAQISEAEVKNAKLTLVRGKEGKGLAESLKGLKKTEDQSPEKPEKAPKAANTTTELPKLQLDNLAFNTLFEFVDYKTTNSQPNRIGFDLSIQATDITTFGSKPESDWGNLKIGGSLHENPQAFATDIQAKVAPLNNPLKASFTAEGKIVAIDMRELGSLSEEIGITSSSVDLTLKLLVKNGIFKAGSEVTAMLRDAQLDGDLKKKNGKTTLPPEISLTLPVSGTLTSPIMNIQQAITTSILRNLASNPDYILDNVTVDGKSLRQRLNKAIGGKDDDKNDSSKAVDDTLNKLKGLFK